LSGLRARAVEAAGRRAGGSDGVEVVMRKGLDGALDRRAAVMPGDAPAGAPLGATTPTPTPAAAAAAAASLTNGAVVKALLCAALYPQVRMAALLMITHHRQIPLISTHRPLITTHYHSSLAARSSSSSPRQAAAAAKAARAAARAAAAAVAALLS